MAKNIKTYLFCFDDHRGFAEDVRKQFTDTTRYKVLSFQTREEFINKLEEAKENNYCKIAILGVHDNKEQLGMINQLTVEINRIDQKTGIILLGAADKMEEIKKTLKFNIYTYIPQNANSILRIHNAVKKLISEHNIRFFRKRRNFSLRMLIALILLSVLLILFAYFRFPEYF